MLATRTPLVPEAVSIVPRFEPHLVEVVVWYPFGAADEAVAAAAAKVAELLTQPDLGAAFATTPADDDDSPRVATAAMVQAVARLVTERAEKSAAQIVQKVIADLLTTPNTLRAFLPTEPPGQPGMPWLDRGGLAITPDA